MTGGTKFKTCLIISIFLLGMVCTSAAGRTIYVDNYGTGDFNNIQAAINDANDGDTIIVADGTYTGDGNRDIDFLGKAITVRSESGPQNCIIDCNGTESDRHRGFFLHSGENANSAIIGFTITNGYAPLEYIPPPTDMWFSQGGAICCYGSSPTVTNCIISGNSACANANYGYGGGIYTSGDSPTITNCTFSSNRANYQGGGINSYYGRPTITNCTFSSNRANYFGGGIACDWPGSVTLTNCILWRNIASYGSQQISDYGSSTVTYSDVQGGWSGPGNINTDPCFADPCNGDYHLKSQAGNWDSNEGRWTKAEVTSPCIDAGNPMSPIGLEPFPNGGRINMGAYGGTSQASKSYFGQQPCEIIIAGDINGDCKVNFLDFRIMAFHWLQDNNP
ncbi:MAG: hypothetical protein WBC22_01710 [Sedimentisphaerales bacterium]